MPANPLRPTQRDTASGGDPSERGRDERALGTAGAFGDGELDPRVKALFDGAFELPTGERAEFLTRACADPALRAEVEALLCAHELCESEGGNSPKTPLAEQPGQVIGNYKLLEEIGSGGFGVVWMAEQLEPVRRKVALKVLKLGMDTRQVVARFEAERQALALMDHPNIAKVFDGGATERGRPYFVMELVRGEPITRYCDEAGLSIAERLQLFQLVCQAVQHAHTKGIIHRDLKPGNVLVTLHDGKPVPKVIDFGVAKATRRELTTKTFFTEFRQMLGTPEYMAPEQAELSGLDVDTRADVYSLGVLLYELLTGRRPFELKDAVQAGGEELLRRIKEDEPPKPSTRASTLGRDLAGAAKARRVHPKALPHLLRRDLDWLVMKALEKDRNRRYDTASAFAEDVQRYLDDRPVIAGPPSRVYQFTKYLRRHRVGAIAVAAVSVSLFAGLAVSLLGYADAREKEQLAIAAGRDAHHQRAAALFAQQQERELRLIAQANEEEAKKQAQRAATMVELLQRMLAGSDPHEVKGPNYTLRELLEDFERERAILQDQPEVEATLRRTMGLAYLGLGLPRRAEPHLEAALATRRSLHGEDHASFAESLLDRSRLLHDLGDFPGAEEHARRALALRERLAADPETIAAVLDTVADDLRHLVRFREALEYATRAYEMRRSVLGEERALVASEMRASLLGEQGDIAGAEELLLRILAVRRQVFGGDDLSVAGTLTSLALLAATKGALTDAEAHHLEALEIRRKHLGAKHPAIAKNLNDLGSTLQQRGELDGAKQRYDEALEMRRELLGEVHPDVAESMTLLAAVLRKQGHLQEAEQLHREAFAMITTHFDEESFSAAKILENLGTLLYEKGDSIGAEELRAKALTIQEKLFGAGHFCVADSHRNFAQALEENGKLKEAELHLQQSLDTYRELLAQGQPHQLGLARSLSNWGHLLTSEGDAAAAVRALEEALLLFRESLGEKNADVARAMSRLALALSSRDVAEAEVVARKALELRLELFGEGHPTVGDSHSTLGFVLKEKGDFAEAARHFSLALGIDPRAHDAPHPNVAALLNNLGVALEGQGDLDGAEQRLREALKIAEACFPDEHPSVATERYNLAHVLEAKSELAESEELYRQSLWMSRKFLPAEHPTLAAMLHSFGRVLEKLGDHGEAAQYLRAALSIREKLFGPENRELLDSLIWLGKSLTAKGDVADAERMLSDALANRTKLLGDDHPVVAAILVELVSVLQVKGEHEHAEKLLLAAPALQREVAGDEHAEVVHKLAHLVQRRGEDRRSMELHLKCLDLRRAALGSAHAKVSRDLKCLVEVQEKVGEIEGAKASRKERIAILRTVVPGSTQLADELAVFGLFLLERDQPAEAEPILRECLELRTTLIPNDPKRMNAMSMYGGALCGLGRYPEAEPYLREGFEKMPADFDRIRRRQAIERIVKLYEAWGRPTQAEDWKAKLAAATESKDR